MTKVKTGKIFTTIIAATAIGSMFSAQTSYAVTSMKSTEYLTAKETHSQVLMDNGNVIAWGAAGDIKRYAENMAGDRTAKPRQVLQKIQGLSAPGYISSAVANGKVLVWNPTWEETQGNDTTTSENFPVFEVEGIDDAVSTASTRDAVFALKSDGTVWGWGRNGDDEILGKEDKGYVTATPIDMGLTNIVAIDGDYGTMAALDSHGDVYVWGKYLDSVDRLAPHKIPTMTHMKAIAVGPEFIVGVRRDGNVYSVGKNLNGVLGIGMKESEPYKEAQRVLHLEDVVDVAAEWDHVLALKKDGTVWSWGNNDRYVLGYDTSGETIAEPTLVPGIADVLEISTGKRHSLALKADGTVWGWGFNHAEQVSGILVEDLKSKYPDGIPQPIKVHEVNAFTQTRITINGVLFYFEQPPVTINGSTLVPLRDIFEVLGASVSWDPATNEVTATKGTGSEQTTVKLTLNSETAYINGREVTLSVPAQTVNNRTVVPLRFVSEALGADVKWVPEYSLVKINVPEEPIPEEELEEETGDWQVEAGPSMNTHTN
ncbi:stalk domain-containing protein [Paenibacillus sp. TRM 82003]|nr:stalk domain-containing protein [Paenibacillus sp. TRM 82003]